MANGGCPTSAWVCWTDKGGVELCTVSWERVNEYINRFSEVKATHFVPADTIPTVNRQTDQEWNDAIAAVLKGTVLTLGQVKVISGMLRHEVKDAG